VSALTILCYALSLGLILIGGAGLLFPEVASHVYGIRVSDPPSRGFVRATAVRDICIGVALAVATYAHVLLLLVTLIAIGIAISFVDFAIVFHSRGKRVGVSHAGHAAGAIAFIVALGMALFAIGR
jgi:energy-converting hydrogenase Eha subunit E